MSRPGQTSGWDLGFLRAGLLVTLPVTAVAVLLVGVLRGWTAALGVLAGAVVVTAFFTASGLVVTWAGRIDDSWTLPAALGTFLAKMVLLAALLNALPADGWLDLRVLGWTVVAGALLWGVVQGRWVWTRQLYYATAPPPPGTAAAQRAPVPPPVDQETRTTRG